MSEMMRVARFPAIEALKLQAENRKLGEALEAAQNALAAAHMANAVLTHDNGEMAKELQRADRALRVTMAERDDARHERDALRARRDRAYAYAIATNRQASRRGKRRERVILAAITAAWGIPALTVLCGKAVAWIGWMMGR